MHHLSCNYLRRLSLALFLCFSMNAADTTGVVSGVVKDSSGAVAVNVNVTLVNTGTNASLASMTDTEGAYFFRNLPVGEYALTVQQPGFKKYVSKGIRVQVNETARVDVDLQVGDIDQIIDVSGQVEFVNTTSIALRTVVDQQRIESLPLNGRNPVQLMQLVAGVTPDSENANVTSDTTYPGVTPVSVNGGRTNTTNYILDGGQNNDHYSNAPNPMPNPDALQEFSVQTNSFSAEFGRQAGGIVNAVTRSGTNDVHGSAFWYVRNNALNAVNFFAPALPGGGKQDDGLKRNQFGATVGGPVFIPKLYNGRNKTFFLYSFQGTRTRVAPSVVQQLVPTAAQRAGDFSSSSIALNNPAGGVFPNNKIPANLLSPISQQMLSFVPQPAGGANTISYAIPSIFNENQNLIKIDHNFSDRNRFSGRFWDSKASQPAFLSPTNFLTATPGHIWENTSVVGNDSHTFTPNVINTAYFSFNRMNNANNPITPKSYNDIGIKLYTPDIKQWYVDVNGYFTLNTNDTNTFFRQEISYSDTVRWQKGHHSISFGGEYGHGAGDTKNNFRGNGHFTFSGDSPFTGDSLADFLIGKFGGFEQGIGEYKNTRFNIISAFVQDSFRATSRLTLDLGMRWEPFLPYTDINGKLTGWRPGQQSTRYPNAPRGVLYPGDPGLPDGGYSASWKNLGPRAGFALDVFGDGSTAVRGGYGIFYDRPNTISTNSAANQAPFGTVVTLNGNTTNSFADPYAGAVNPFPSPLNPPGTVRFTGPMVAFSYAGNMRNAYIQSYNLTVERRLIKDILLRLAYAGSKGTDLVDIREINPAIYAPGATTSTTDRRRALYPSFGQLSLVEPGSTSQYNALQATLEKRFSSGFSFLANYTWAKSIDTGSFAKQTGQTVMNPNNLRQDKGVSDFDRRQVFVLSGLWDLPIHPKQRFANFLIGGWNLTGIVTARSGFPLAIASGVDNARTGTGRQRPDLIGNPQFSGDRSRNDQVTAWLNPAAFAPNALGTFGTLGRNALFGPGYSSSDVGLHKAFPIRENVKVEFRFEAFNALNQVNLQSPNLKRSSGNFMRITSANDPRILQLALRLAW